MKTISLRVCVLQILYKDYFEDPSGNSLRWQRLFDENYHLSFMNPLTTRSIFLLSSYLVCTTVAWVTINRWVKFVDEVGSTDFYRNISWEFATSRSITKADRPKNFTILHCRMSTMQPAWPGCATSECWHTRCWHFSSCSSHKTMPFLRELVVTHLLVLGCYVTALSTGITQVFILIARIGYEVK